jgi:hypothetical protein
MTHMSPWGSRQECRACKAESIRDSRVQAGGVQGWLGGVIGQCPDDYKKEPTG